MIVFDSKSFGQAIRRYRKIRGATQVQLAGVANTGLRFIIDLEKGKPTVQLGKALRVAYVLGMQFEVPTIDGVEP